MARFVLLAQLSVPPALEDEFNLLYDTEHIPPLLKLKGVHSVRRFRLISADADDYPEYLAIYELDDPGLPTSPEWRRLADGGHWAVAIRPHLKIRWHNIFEMLSEHALQDVGA